MKSQKCPNLIIIGNTAYDTKEYVIQNKIRERDIGGACLYSAIPASLFAKVGIVSKIGGDFEVDKIKNYNIDFSGVKILYPETTTHFYTKFFSSDGQDSITYGQVSNKMTICFNDIPKHYLKAKYIHFTTSEPVELLKMIKEVKKNSDAILSVDTNLEFAKLSQTKEIFDIVDIAFIDKEFIELLDCDAKIKIIKLGEEGCILKTQNEELYYRANIKEKVVDKLGAGDCLNGVIMNLIANRYDIETAIKKGIEIATLSIDDYGILDLKNKFLKLEGTEKNNV